MNPWRESIGPWGSGNYGPLKDLLDLSAWSGSNSGRILAAMNAQFKMPKLGQTMKYRAGVAVTGLAQKYAGAVYSHRTGKVVLCPMAHTHFAVYDPAANTINESAAAHGQTGTRFFAGCCLLDDGRVFAVPYDSANCVIFDPADNSVEVMTGGTLPGASTRFAGCAQAYNGKVVMTPYGVSVVGLYDVTTKTYSAGPSTGGAGTFECAVAHPNGNIYFSPLGASRVGWYKPSDNTFNTSGMAALSGSLRFQGAVVVPSGKVVMVPFNYASIGVYDPATDTWAESAAHGKGSNAWNGAVLLGDGRVLMVPRAADNFGIFDPEAMTYSNGPTSASWTAVDAFCGGAMLPNGTYVAAPYTHTTVGLIDTFTMPMFPDHASMHPALQHY